MMKKRKSFEVLLKRLQEPRRFIQCHSGMEAFAEQFNPDRILLVGDQGIPLEKFLSTAPHALFK